MEVVGGWKGGVSGGWKGCLRVKDRLMIQGVYECLSRVDDGLRGCV